MSDDQLGEVVKDKFHYLLDEYSFSVEDELYDLETFGSSLGQFRLDSMEIAVLFSRFTQT